MGDRAMMPDFTGLPLVEGPSAEGTVTCRVARAMFSPPVRVRVTVDGPRHGVRNGYLVETMGGLMWVWPGDIMWPNWPPLDVR